MSDGWFLSGIYYGYPVCCIDEFIYYAESDLCDEREDRQLSGTGYVPCKKCNEKSERELLDAIDNNRIHWQKFPTCSPNTEAFVDFTREVAATYLRAWSKEE